MQRVSPRISQVSSLALAMFFAASVLLADFAEAATVYAPLKWGLYADHLGDSPAELCDTLDTPTQDYVAQPPISVTGPAQGSPYLYDITLLSNCIRDGYFGGGAATYGNYCPPPGSWSQGTKTCNLIGTACPAGMKLDTTTNECWPVVEEDERSKDPEQCPKCGNPIYPLTGIKRERFDTHISIGGVPLTFTYDTSRAPWTEGTIPRVAGEPAGTLGPLWWSSFHRRHYMLGGNFRVTRGDGRVTSFGNFGAQSEIDVADKLTGTNGGRFYRDQRALALERYVSGAMLKRVTASGQTLDFVYSTASTPASVAPGAGYLITVKDVFGHAVGFTYTTVSGTVVVSTITDQQGQVLQFAYDAGGNLQSITGPDSQARTFVYESSSHPWALTGVIREDGIRYSTFGYDSVGRASSTEHAGAVDRYSIAYQSPPQVAVSEARDAANHRFVRSRTWVAPQSPVMTLPNGADVTLQASLVAGLPRMTSESLPGCTNCTGPTRNTAYDTAGNLLSKEDFNGNKVCSSYATGRNVETARLEGVSGTCPSDVLGFSIPAGSVIRKISMQWHPQWDMQTRRAEPGRITTWVYNGQVDPTVGGAAVTCAPSNAKLPDGWPIAVVCRRIEEPTNDATGSQGFAATSAGAARITTYTYNVYGQLLTANGPRTDVTDVTTYTYYNCTTGYQCGQVNTLTNALGHVTTFNTYNAHGQPLTITDANGVVTTLTYDLRQRLTLRTVGTEQTTFEYWPTGLLKKATLPDSSYLEYGYDAAHRLTDINDADGNHIHYTLDAMGNRTKEEVFDSAQVLARTRTQVFNTLNQLWKQIGAAGGANVTTSFGYDNNGNQTAINAPLSRTTAQTYDELNRLKTVTDPASGLTTYGYDALDQLISVTDPKGLTMSYTYNGLGDLKQQVSPDTGTTINTFDSGGNLKTSTDARSKLATYAYDALNRVTSVTYADQVIGYTYDTGTNQKGRLTQLTDNSGSTSWSYDAHGRVLSRQQTMGAISKSVGYSYDAYGRPDTLTLPSGNVITYGYASGKVVSLTLNGSTTLLSNVLYHPFGPTTGWTWGNSTFAVRDYDQDGKITLADSAGMKTYAYDDAFRISGITDATDPNLSQSYDYDLLDRLTSATGTTLNQSWTYDDNGNRLTQGGSQSSTYTVSGTSNRVSSISGALTRTYGYDNAGNTTSDGSATFTYNDAGRMVSATKAGVTATYGLNGLGQRVRKIIGGASTYFVYDEARHLVGEYDNAGNLIAETVWFGDIPVVVLKPNGGGGVNVFYIHTDHLNTPRKITRPSDEVIVWRWDSDPFGTTVADENPSGIGVFSYNLRFPGQYYDQETGLNYNGYRDYDPNTGRYVQSDPIGLGGGINTYGYVGANPLSLVDLYGLDAADVGTIVGCGIVGGIGSTIGLGGGAAGGLACGPGAVVCSPTAAVQGAVALGAAGCTVGGTVGRAIGKVIDKLCGNNADDCKIIETEIAALAQELRWRFLMAQLDPNDLYNRARVTRLSRREGSYYGHRKQFLEKQATLRELITLADARKCTVKPEDRALSMAPYPDFPLP